MGAPLWFGEVGFDHHDPRAAAFENAYVDAMADAGSGWAWWQWRQNGGWGIRNVGGTGIDVAALRRLARPCLLAAPGGVRSRWQPSAGRGALALEVSASHDASRVVVGWLNLLLPAPSARGTCLAGSAWQPNAGQLTLRLLPGKGCVIRLIAEPF